LPRHYAEALLIHSSQTRKPIDLKGWTLDPVTTDRFREIMAAMRDMGGNKAAAFTVLAPRFGDTYTFYSLFNVTGAK
jgi:hypothetical protein